MKHPGELNVLARTLFLKCADEPATGFMRVELVALIKNRFEHAAGNCHGKMWLL